MSWQHTSAARKRTHSAAQRKILHYCDCGMAITGNAAWWSHRNARPDHKQLSRAQYRQRFPRGEA